MSLVTWETYWSGQHGQQSSAVGRWLFRLREQRVGVAYARVAMRYATQRGRVLEAGCGSAVGSLWLAKLRHDEIVALDIFDRALEVVRDRATFHQVAVALVRGDLRTLPFPDKTFDLCWNSGTLEHFYHDDVLALIREMRRVSKVALGIVPAQHPIWSWPLKIARWMGPKVESLVLEGGYYRLYREREFRGLFEEAGFDRVESMTMWSAGFPFVVAAGFEATPRPPAPVSRHAAGTAARG